MIRLRFAAVSTIAAVIATAGFLPAQDPLFQKVEKLPPQVQDGALAWGDFDNDGDLDLAITGSRSADPEEGDLVAVILRNTPTGPFLFDREFVNILPGPWLRGCRFGLLQWIDYDNDGDLDLFYSGERSPAGTPFWELDRTAGVYPESNQPPSEGEERDEMLATNVQWQDFDDDGLLDVLVSAQSVTYSQVAQIWLNRSTFMSGPGEFVRLGRQMVFESALPNWPVLSHWIPDPPDPFQSGRAEPWATVADWDMNGRPELATFQTSRANRVVEAGDGRASGHRASAGRLSGGGGCGPR